MRDDIKDEINKTIKRIWETKDCLDDMEIRLYTMEQVLISMWEDKGVKQEGRLRRENIRQYNLPEDKEGSSMTTFVETHKLDIPSTTELYIERAHRALAQKPMATMKPRSIVITFH